MRHIVICGLPRYTIFIHIYLTNGTIFRKKKLLHTKCVLISLQLLSETFFILRRTERDMIKMYIGLHVKYRCYSCRIVMKLEFSLQFFEKYSNIKFHEIRPVGAELFHVDRWTDGHI
jgi:hypothetical protein